MPSLPRWVIPTPLTPPPPSKVLAAALGAGETEAVSPAVERAARILVVDDRAARRLAQSLGLPIVGTLGVLLAGKRLGVLQVRVGDRVVDVGANGTFGVEAESAELHMRMADRRFDDNAGKVRVEIRRVERP
jgi:predicted nucleic acid-binding protein